MSDILNTKLLLFEYLVCKLWEWKHLVSPFNNSNFTKLQLQKLLFLTAAATASLADRKLFKYFFNFYALQYGPVELDIYHAMLDNKFETLSFESRICKIKSNMDRFNSLSKEDKDLVDDAIIALKSKSKNYVLYDSFKLVSITHEWTIWKTSYAYAEILGKKMERMEVKDIIQSNIKAF